jgi:membrane-associated protease RseP (regulator of RpoE activity)
VKTKKVCIIIIGLLLFIGCAHEAQNKSNIEQLVAANPGSFVEIPFIGFQSEENNSKEVVVTKVVPNEAAEKADIRVGDVIISVDNNVIRSKSQSRKIAFTKHPGDKISYTIRRNNNTFEKVVTLGKRYVSYDVYVLMKKIIDEKPVRLAIIVGEVSTAYVNQPGWNKGIESQLLTEAENFYIRTFINEKNFEIVDRAAVLKILGELDLQQSRYVSDESRIKLGKMLGVTDLLILSFSRFRSSAYGWQDTKYRKLIDVETGKILASIAIKNI